MAKNNMPNSFETLFQVNVNEHTEKKNGLTYLSWAYAWAEVKKRFIDATYEIKKFGENNLPYVYDENTGYMVFTSVTIDGLTHEMWLPVMDGSNKAMKSKSYTYKTKYGEKTVESATMFDINKTIMRCLVKNLAMFGLGLYIYSGEDLPEEIKPILSKPIANTINILIKKVSETTNTDKSKIIDDIKMFIGKDLKLINDVEGTKILKYLETKIQGDE